MKAKILKTEEEYQEALAYVDELMDAEPGSAEEEELELFAVLVENYERERYPIDLPDPVSAIEFRMEQQGLSRKDLVPYLGSLSKISEVLNGKRPLSLTMIRALHSGLGIPAEILLQEMGKKLAPKRYDWRDYPFAEMVKQGYFEGFRGTLREAKEFHEEILERFFESNPLAITQRIYCRQSVPARTASLRIAESQAAYSAVGRADGEKNPQSQTKTTWQVDEPALAAWHIRAMHLAEQQNLPAYEKTRFTTDFLREIVALSDYSLGPLMAQELLAKNGVALILLPHLPKTYLDGACFATSAGRPVIGMTLRYDRLDNFWFTLIHELAHLILHLDERVAFFDDTENDGEVSDDPREIEANALAWETLIPTKIWEREKALLLRTDDEREILAFAGRMRISPAIVAGRVRWETGDYARFSSLIGSKQVRKIFYNSRE